MQSADQSYHIGMASWETNSGELPKLLTVTPEEGSSMAVLVENITSAFTQEYTSGTASLPTFTNTNKEAYTIELSNKGSVTYNYTVTPSADWITVSKKSGSVESFDSLQVSVDWSKLTASAAGSVTISDGSSTVVVDVAADIINTEGLTNKTYVMANNYATIDVSNFAAVKAGSGITNAGVDSKNEMILEIGRASCRESVLRLV